MVEEGGGGVGVAGPGGQVERGVAGQVQLVGLQSLPGHLLAQPASYTVLQRGERSVSSELYWWQTVQPVNNVNIFPQLGQLGHCTR